MHRLQVEAHEKRAILRRERFWNPSNTADPQDPDIHDIIGVLWMQNARKGQHRAHVMKADNNRKKVEGWLESVK